MNRVELALEYLNMPGTEWTGRTAQSDKERATLGFQVTPEEYLTFAEEDLTLNGKRGLINALSNAKRSMDCRIDYLFDVLGLYKEAKSRNWSVPKKIAILNEMGLVAPRVLSKINRARNLIEHDFEVPDAEQVADFIDVVALFIASLKPHVMGYPAEVEYTNENWPEDIAAILTIYDRDDLLLKIVIDQPRTISRLKADAWRDHDWVKRAEAENRINEEVLMVKCGDPEFFRVLGTMLDVHMRVVMAT